MMCYLLDTNICVFFLRGKLNFNQIVGEHWRECCCISEITVFELRYGAENSNNPQKHHFVVDIFLSGLKVIPIVKSSPKKRVAPRKKKPMPLAKQIAKPAVEIITAPSKSTTVKTTETITTESVNTSTLEVDKLDVKKTIRGVKNVQR